jgi:hypothetical protein
MLNLVVTYGTTCQGGLTVRTIMTCFRASTNDCRRTAQFENRLQTDAADGGGEVGTTVRDRGTPGGPEYEHR